MPWWASRHKGTGRLADDFGLRMAWRDVPIGLAAGFVAQLLLSVALLPLYDLLGVDTDEVGETAERLTDRADDPLTVAILLLVVAVGSPVVEELCYRGLWLRAIERRAGSVVAVLGSSLVFGAVHFQLADTIALVGFGLVAGVLAVRAGRLGPAIWAHVAFNLTALVSLLT